MSLSERIKDLIRHDPRPIKRLAVAAGVDYQSLYRWFHGKTANYDVDKARKVYQALTGEDFDV